MGTTQRDLTSSTLEFVAERRSPTTLILALGLILFVIGGIVLRTGVWAAILGVWGVALLLVGVCVHVAVRLIRR